MAKFYSEATKITNKNTKLVFTNGKQDFSFLSWKTKRSQFFVLFFSILKQPNSLILNLSHFMV